MQQKNLSGDQSQLVPFTQAGTKGLIDPSTVNNWKKHHGTTKTGIEVNSVSSARFGDSILIEAEDGQVISVGADELEVFVVQQAALFGYAVAPK